MAISISTDYVADEGDPEPYLQRIAEAGFSHVHWCHHWKGDFLYSKWEIKQIGRWLKGYGLQLLNLHASMGTEKNWASLREYERRAGVEMVRNRLEMTSALGGDVIIMHVPVEPEEAKANRVYWAQLRKSLRTLAPVARRCGVRIAVENGRFATIRKLLAEYPPDYLGLCYDAGHANCRRDKDGMEQLEPVKDRLIALHLHDNDGQGDQHKIPFMGTVDWPRLAATIASSAYTKCVNVEALIRNTGYTDEAEFLKRAFEEGTRFAAMIDARREAGGS
jgi:sugar phosphate isomerase/epimerase